jgi:nucleotide-binding universal stress UspA family protein
MPPKSKKILVATELALPSAHTVLDKALALAGADDTIDVLYVVDPTTVEYTVDPTLSGTMYEEIYNTTIGQRAAQIAKTVQTLCYCR